MKKDKINKGVALEKPTKTKGVKTQKQKKVKAKPIDKVNNKIKSKIRLQFTVLYYENISHEL